MLPTPYDILGLTPEATADEIKRAYFKLVRSHPPETDPEGFQRLQQAYEFLSDPESRKAYNQEAKHGGRLAELRARVEDARERGAWDDAVRALKEILLLTPEDANIHNMIGICCMELEQWEAAAKAFEKVTAAVDGHPTAWKHLGISCMRIAYNAADGPETLRRAAACFLKSGSVVPFDGETFFLAARAFFDLGDYDQALECADRSVMADGKIDLQDFEALFLVCAVCLEQPGAGGLDLALGRLHSVVPDELEPRDFVCERFLQVAWGLLGGEKIDSAARAVGAAISFNPGHPACATFEKLLATVRAAKEELADFDRDPEVPDSFKALTWTTYRAKLSDDPALAEEFDNSFFLVASESPQNLKRIMKRMRKTYPALAVLLSDSIGSLSAPAAAGSDGNARRNFWLAFIAIALIRAILSASDGPRNRTSAPGGESSRNPAAAGQRSYTPPPSRNASRSSFIHAGPSSNPASRISMEDAAAHRDPLNIRPGLEGVPHPGSSAGRNAAHHNSYGNPSGNSRAAPSGPQPIFGGRSFGQP